MSVASLLSKAQAMGVRLILNGNGVKLRGPAESIAAIKPELAAHKPEIVAHLRRAANDVADTLRCPVADGPYMPYMMPMPPERVAGLLADLRTTIGKVADIEGWPDERRAHLLGLVARQPAFTLADDLAYFRERLNAIEAVARAAEIGRQARAEHDAIRKCGTCRHMMHHDHGVPVRCQMGRALGWRHHDWLDAPDVLNTCNQHHPKRG
ncbi:hypothetical protein [Ralstonia pseudosolanacearum]|uniref:Uncharacterized protein n=1 Tax=Ralstonia nicotianae (strain ATCC BAA-1114 / GMI1000) TaxID=267608 RepID=Q8XWJ2_RALN1|nr:hypothetical protein [Ralstonia pseudosolanacearum]AST27999.1 hypothetical protein CDC45_12630 [Ralstonia pseudosolanacearum]MCQ4681763.1 hypothetical protein [Ralstonia pseudosolanacearum]MDC6285101.1 hypothetical protein [Ralstonia pseudosolanacearum]CAD16189.1 conserved hypothetical protein [Ralstonia pseudosolanacearum GMI1000]